MAEKQLGCGRPTGSVVGENRSIQEAEAEVIQNKEDSIMQVKVGKKAPDFEAPAYFKGEFKNVKLSDYLGKWVLLCFYPGDFTFV